MREDAELVAAACGGDREAFAPLVERWFDRCWNVSWRILHDQEEAADVAQETFVTAWQQLGNLQEPAAFGGWVLRISRNRSLDRLARARRTMSTGDDEVFDAATGDVSADEPADAVQRGTQHDLVWAAAAALGERDASLLDLHLRHGLEPHELAEELDISPNAAHQALFRLRARLGDAVRAWLLWHRGEPRCVVLTAELTAAGHTSFGSPMVRAIGRHVDECLACSKERDEVTAPAALFGAVPLLVVPALVRSEAMLAIRAAGVPIDAPASGPSAPSGADEVGEAEPGMGDADAVTRAGEGGVTPAAADAAPPAGEDGATPVGGGGATPAVADAVTPAGGGGATPGSDGPQAGLAAVATPSREVQEDDAAPATSAVVKVSVPLGVLVLLLALWWTGLPGFMTPSGGVGDPAAGEQIASEQPVASEAAVVEPPAQDPVAAAPAPPANLDTSAVIDGSTPDLQPGPWRAPANADEEAGLAPASPDRPSDDRPPPEREEAADSSATVLSEESASSGGDAVDGRAEDPSTAEPPEDPSTAEPPEDPSTVEPREDPSTPGPREDPPTAEPPEELAPPTVTFAAVLIGGCEVTDLGPNYRYQVDWATEGADAVTLDPGTGPTEVGDSGMEQMCVLLGDDIVLTATNAAGTATESIATP